MYFFVWYTDNYCWTIVFVRFWRYAAGLLFFPLMILLFLIFTCKKSGDWFFSCDNPDFQFEAY
ncbi:MAG TPA: hypothetical protein DCY35_04985 [Prolixibacteraceae bacterium]|nr:hypothetical protein [Prolixibacteraceae bacterium]